MKDKRSSKKKRLLLHFLFVFRLVAQRELWLDHIYLGIFGALGQFGETSPSFQNHEQGYKKSNSQSSIQNFASRRPSSSLKPISEWSYTYLRIFGAIGQFVKKGPSYTCNGHGQTEYFGVFLFICKGHLRFKLLLFQWCI